MSEITWLEQHAYDLRNAIAATDESITSDAQILMQPMKMMQRIIDLETALYLIGECTACSSCKHRALDALAGGTSKRIQVKIAALKAQNERLREALTQSKVYARHRIMCPHLSENMTSNSDCNCAFYDWQDETNVALQQPSPAQDKEQG